MKKVIAVFGAGEGLGKAVALRFGREGYNVALVSRKITHLETIAAELAAVGIEAFAFPADLSQASSAGAVTQAIKGKLGKIDVVYYAPSTTDAFINATDVTATKMRPLVELCLFSLFDVVDAVLPDMLARGGGAILSAVGGDLSIGLPYMSGFAVGHAAARNYLYSLGGEVIDQGVNVALVSISGVVKNSDYYREFEAGTNGAPDDLVMPVIDPNDLADALWEAAAGRRPVEIPFPTRKADTLV